MLCLSSLYKAASAASLISFRSRAAEFLLASKALQPRTIGCLIWILSAKRASSRVVRAGAPMGRQYVGALDQGTTSTRFIIYDEDAKPISCHQLEHAQICPQGGWVEHNPTEILQRVREVIQGALQVCREAGHRVTEETLKAVGITNQRETTIAWSRRTGQPLHNAVVWLDTRTRQVCKSLQSELPDGAEHFREVSGLPISTYFSALKMKWLLDNVPEIQKAAADGDCLFGTMDSWLIYNLTGGAGKGVYVTDCTNAARTMLMDLRTLQWHKPFLDEFGIKEDMLPRIASNSEVYGEIAEGWPLAGVPIAGCLGDQMAATLGQRCRKGEAKNTYGTGCFLLLNTGEDIVSSTSGMLTTLSFKLGPSAPAQYALEGSIAVAGGAVQWLRDNLGIIKSMSEVEELARTVEDTSGVYFVPAFSGLFAPRWRSDARGIIVGLTQHSNKAHIARAVLEAICFQTREVLDAMKKDVTCEGENVLRVDGGASNNELLMQLQADLLGCPVQRPANVETTALGAALAAGLAVGLWTEEQLFSGLQREHPKTFRPSISDASKELRYKSWCRAVERSFESDDLSGS